MTPSPTRFGPVRVSERSRVALRPIRQATITGGFWADRRHINREVSVPSAWQRLQEAGNLSNLELAAGLADGEYASSLPFLDSDVYKWLEAVGWTLADPELSTAGRAQLQDRLETVEKLLGAAQAEDGYLDSYFQVRFPGMRFEQLQWGHELYCAGHLIQAAIAVHRATGTDGLLRIAQRFADLIVRSFGTADGRIDGIDGHPEIETALVELYRETGERAYLDAARYFVDRRGHGVLGSGAFGAHYWQDQVPVRDATAVAGHAVRQLYLLAGVADVHAETGDASLRETAERLWKEMAATRTYVTGGIGAHHLDEAFGDPYELTNERSYCETCAAIGSIMFSWRMLLITGEARYADLMERTLYNGFLAGLSLDGQRYIYANPLQVRDGHLSAGNDHDYVRKPWFACACCPPNVMRLLASLEHYVAVSGADEIRLHQYATGRFTASLAGGEVTLEVETDYPWDGRIRVIIAAAPGNRWSLTVRVPHWAEQTTAYLNDDRLDVAGADGWLRIDREWRSGDEVIVELPLSPRFTHADPRVDADRGLVAIERGPLVYCVESADQPSERLDDVVVDPAGGLDVAGPAPDLGDAITLKLTAEKRQRRSAGWWPYGSHPMDQSAGPVTLTAIPYYAWGNRQPGAMRVWLRAE
jgi:DUF1680 family protein